MYSALKVFLVTAVIATSQAACGNSPGSTDDSSTDAAEAPSAKSSASGVPPNVGDKALQIGEAREGLSASMQLIEIKFPYPPGPYNKPDQGNAFLGLRVKQCLSTEFVSEPGESFTSAFTDDWAVASSTGEQAVNDGLTDVAWPRPRFQEAVTMNPGDCVQGWQAIQIPADYQIEKLIYRPGGETVAEWIP